RSVVDHPAEIPGVAASRAARSRHAACRIGAGMCPRRSRRATDQPDLLRRTDLPGHRAEPQRSPAGPDVQRRHRRIRRAPVLPAPAGPSAALACSFAALATAAFVRLRSTPALLWAVVAAAFAVQFRPEAVLVAPVIVLAIAVCAPGEFRQPRFWWAGAVALIL